MNATKTGALIAERRKALGLTQKELAEKLLVSPKTVSKWECGGGFPDVGILMGLSTILEISVTQLLTGGEEKTPLPKTEQEGGYMDVWKKYAVREKWKTFGIYACEAAIIAASLTGFLISLFHNRWNIPCAVCCVFFAAVLCLQLGSFRFRDWRKAETATSRAIVLGKKIRTAGGGSATGYPCITVRMTGDRKKTLDTVSWDVYDALYPGDEILVRYQGFVLIRYELLRQGAVSQQAAQEQQSAAVFHKAYVKTQARWRHFPVAAFQTDSGKKLMLRTPEGWTAPKCRTAGTLRWHGEWLDSFSADTPNHT